MSKQFEQIGQTHLMEWPDIGYRCRIMLCAGRVEISLAPLNPGWNPAPFVQGRALPGRVPEFYPPPQGPEDSAVRHAARRSLEALDELGGGSAGRAAVAVGAASGF